MLFRSSVHGIFSDQITNLHSNVLGEIAKTTEENVLKWADKLTTDSKITQKTYKEKLGMDFEYLPSAIDTTKLDEIPNIEKKYKQIAYIGRDSYEKGIDILRGIESKINGNVVYCTNLPWKEAMTILKSSTMLVVDRKSTRLNSSHMSESRMPSSA